MAGGISGDGSRRKRTAAATTGALEAAARPSGTKRPRSHIEMPVQLIPMPSPSKSNKNDAGSVSLAPLLVSMPSMSTDRQNKAQLSFRVHTQRGVAAPSPLMVSCEQPGCTLVGSTDAAPPQATADAAT
jgi:hypothetical protein